MSIYLSGACDIYIDKICICRVYVYMSVWPDNCLFNYLAHDYQLMNIIFLNFLQTKQLNNVNFQNSNDKINWDYLF